MRIVGYAVGAVLIAIGARGLLISGEPLLGWAVWFGGLAVAHDLLVVPATAGLGLVANRVLDEVPAPSRGPLRSALVVAGCLTLVALPFVLGFGHSSDNPSRLPLHYGTNLLNVVAIVILWSGVIAVLKAYRDGMARTILSILGVLLGIWLVFTVIGTILSSLKFFFFIGLAAVVVMIIVGVIAKSAKSR